MDRTFITVEVPTLPKGWRYTSELRVPKYGEYYYQWTSNGPAQCNSHDFTAPRFIVKDERPVVAIILTWEKRRPAPGEDYVYRIPQDGVRVIPLKCYPSTTLLDQDTWVMTYRQLREGETFTA